MAFLEMYQELTGQVPKLDPEFSKTLINRSLRDIYRRNLWSFQLFEDNWISPAIINGGSVTVTQGTNTVVFNATASALITAVSLDGPFPTPLIQRQFRQSIPGTIYNIWAYAVDGGGIVTLTLDRPYVESSGSGLSYMIYQCYYPAPMQDFLTWISVRDMTNFNDLRTVTTREQLDERDPQRSIFYLPTDVAYYQTEKNTASPSYRFPLFELWGQPAYVLPYQLYGIRRGPLLVNDTDELPAALGEDVVIEGAKVKAYEWAEANKGDVARGQGTDFRFLVGVAKAEFERLIRGYRKDDRETCDNWYKVRWHTGWMPNVFGYFNALSNTANPGAPW